MPTAAYLELEEGDAPSTPGTGYHRVYALNDNNLYYKNDTGDAIPITGNRSAIITQQTTDATVTTVTTVSVAEASAVIVKVRAIAARADYSAALGREAWAVFRRATAGNVTAVGTSQGTGQEDSAGSPTVTFAADTGNQTVDINVTGIAATTWNWTLYIETLVENA